MKSLFAAVAVALAFAVTAPVTSTDAFAHGCHRDVERGEAGWHYHVGPGCRRIAAAAPRRHFHRYGGNRCVERCNYIGPIKQCERVC